MTAPLHSFTLDRLCLAWADQIRHKTGLKHWNEVCRLAFCVALTEDTLPPPLPGGRELSNVTIEWTTFAGRDLPLYAALLHDAMDRHPEPKPASLHELFLRLLARGLQRLAMRPDGLPEEFWKIDTSVVDLMRRS